jgi:hypothetical protein
MYILFPLLAVLYGFKAGRGAESIQSAPFTQEDGNPESERGWFISI